MASPESCGGAGWAGCGIPPTSRRATTRHPGDRTRRGTCRFRRGLPPGCRVVGLCQVDGTPHGSRRARSSVRVAPPCDRNEQHPGRTRTPPRRTHHVHVMRSDQGPACICQSQGLFPCTTVRAGVTSSKIRPCPGRQTSSRVGTQQDRTSRSNLVSRPTTAGPLTRSREVGNLATSSAASPHVPHPESHTARTALVYQGQVPPRGGSRLRNRPRGSLESGRRPPSARVPRRAGAKGVATLRQAGVPSRSAAGCSPRGPWPRPTATKTRRRDEISAPVVRHACTPTPRSCRLHAVRCWRRVTIADKH
jgi:hypothetical protein